MTPPEATGEPGQVHLNDEDIAYLMNFLRNAPQPVTTQQLIDVLRRQSAPTHELEGAPEASS